ncbi:ribonuclease H2 subunit C [Vipera latastei]
MAGEDRSGARLALASLPGASREPLHLLPCSIQHDGPAAVARYFAPALRRDPEAPDAPTQYSSAAIQRDYNSHSAWLVAEDRKGAIQYENGDASPSENPPCEFGVTVLCESDLEVSKLEREVCVKTTFDSLTVWNLEQAPTNSDEILMAFAWPKIAQGLHAPVTDE